MRASLAAKRMELLDQGCQLAYRVAHRGLRLWWQFRRPKTHGALVALWSGEKLLLIRNSYRVQYTLPGGYVRPGESAEQAAARELWEEVAVRVDPGQLAVTYEGMEPFEHRDDHVTIVECVLPRVPRVTIDRREVVWAEFREPVEMLRMRLVPHLERYLRRRVLSTSQA